MNNKFTDKEKQDICDNINTSSINIDEIGYLCIGHNPCWKYEYNINTTINIIIDIHNLKIFCPDFKFIKVYKTKYYKELEKTIIIALNNYNCNKPTPWFYIAEEAIIDLVEYLYNFYEDLLEDLPIR